jgi:hypothetical protein
VSAHHSGGFPIQLKIVAWCASFLPPPPPRTVISGFANMPVTAIDMPTFQNCLTVSYRLAASLVSHACVASIKENGITELTIKQSSDILSFTLLLQFHQ